MATFFQLCFVTTASWKLSIGSKLSDLIVIYLIRYILISLYPWNGENWAKCLESKMSKCLGSYVIEPSGRGFAMTFALATCPADSFPLALGLHSLERELGFSITPDLRRLSTTKFRKHMARDWRLNWNSSRNHCVSTRAESPTSRSLFSVGFSVFVVAAWRVLVSFFPRVNLNALWALGWKWWIVSRPSWVSGLCLAFVSPHPSYTSRKRVLPPEGSTEVLDWSFPFHEFPSRPLLCVKPLAARWHGIFPSEESYPFNAPNFTNFPSPFCAQIPLGQLKIVSQFPMQRDSVARKIFRIIFV